ncbi:IS91 family transposase, partial [Salmonella enterica]|nr:IS91 family transposase [Salmonella enterica]EME9602754.1 IS91 family transposase [Salmonella enterica]
DPLKCILCGNKMCFSGLKRGLRLAELLACHERLAQMKMCG